MININRKNSDKLNQLVLEWQPFSGSHYIEDLLSFLSGHPLEDEDRKEFLYVIFSELYGTLYLSGTRMNVNQFLKNVSASKEFASFGLDKKELARQCFTVWLMGIKESEFSASLNQLFLEWHSSPISRKGVSSFLSEHSDLSAGERKSLLYAILSEQYGLAYLSGKRMNVKQCLQNLTESNEFASFELDVDELTRHCLAVYLHVTKKKPNFEALCGKLPQAADFFGNFWRENRSWLAVLPDALPEPVLPSNHEEIISETYKVPAPPIGHGGQKVVYKIVQQSTEQTLALKVSSRIENNKDLIKEAKTQAGLSHQGIPAVFSLSYGPDTPTRLVERYIVGETWSEILPKLTLEENLDILERTSRILASAHLEHHIIHGDLKPQNVKVNRQYNEVYLVDWGLAIHLDDVKKMSEDTPDAKPTQLVFKGSVDYLPPEVANNANEKVCLATDVFMLGATLYQILAGRPPYSEITPSLVAICYAQAGRWPDLPESGPYGPIPQELREIVEKAMAFEPSDRYTDAGEFADALVMYTKRAKLLERYKKAREYHENLREQYDVSNLDHQAQAHLLADTIANVNDFMSIRTELAETEKDAAEKTPLLREVFESEFAARQILLTKTISKKEFAQASVQLDTGWQSYEDYRKNLSSEPEAMTSFLKQAERDLQRGLAAQRRERRMKWIALCAVCVAVLCLVGVLTLGIYSTQKIADQMQKNAALANEKAALANENTRIAQEKAQKESELRYQADLAVNRQIQPNLEWAMKQRFGQGKLALESELRQFDYHLPVAWQKECTLHTSLLPVQCASAREIIDAVSFSPDERYFIGKTADNYLVCWQTKNGEFVSREQIPENPLWMGDGFISPNPCFQNSKTSTPCFSSEFLILDSKGLILFWNHSGKIEERKKNDYLVYLWKENPGLFPDDDSFSLGRPVFLCQNGSPVMVVGDSQGRILFFSLPDGKLMKQIQVNDKGINRLCLSPDQKHLAVSAEDGLYRYIEIDGMTVEDLNLPLSTDPHPEYGYCRPLEISPDGKLLAAGTETGKVLVWDMANKKPVAEMQEEADEDTPALVIQRTSWLDDSHLLTLCPNGHYRIWNLAKRNQAGVPEFTDLPLEDSLPKLGVRAGALSPSHQKLIISENNQHLALFDLQTGEKEFTSEGFLRCQMNSLSLSIGPEWHPGLGRIIVGGFGFAPIQLYDPDTMQAEDLAPARKSTPLMATGIYASHNSTRFAIALTPYESGDGFIQVYEGNPPVLKKETKSKSKVSFKDGNCYCCALSSDGKILAESVTMDFEVKVHAGKHTKKVTIPGEFLLGYFFNNKNQLITISNPLGAAPHLTRWECDWKSDEAKPVEVEKIDLLNQPFACSLSTDGQLLALGFADGKILLLDSNDYSKQKELDFSTPLYAAKNSFKNTISPPEFPQTDLAPKNNFINTANVVIGISWSSNNEFMMISFSSGKSVLVETENSTVLASCYCSEPSNKPFDCLVVHPIFAGADRLFTFVSNGAVYRWDWVPSPEKPLVLSEKFGAEKIREIHDGTLACRDEGMIIKNPFFILKGKNEIVRIENIAEFEYQPSTDGNGKFLLLKKDGSFEAVNEKGEPVELPASLKTPVQEKITNLCISSDGRWLGLTTEKDVWYMDLQEKEPKWVQIPKPQNSDSFTAMCFAPNRPEIILTTTELHVWNLEKQEFVKKDRLYNLKNIVSLDVSRLNARSGNSKLVVSHRGKYVFQVGGLSSDIVIWNRDSQEMTQVIPLDFPEYCQSIPNIVLLPLDRGFGEWENEEAFVVGAEDGVLRFYQYIPTEGKFMYVYAVSTSRLADYIIPPDNPEYMPFDPNKMLESGYDSTVKIYSPILPQHYWIDALTLSSDGKTLYVGSADDVYSFNMDEIRQNVAGLKEKWAHINVEDLSSLRFDPDLGIRNVNRVLLRKK